MRWEMWRPRPGGLCGHCRRIVRHANMRKDAACIANFLACVRLLVVAAMSRVAIAGYAGVNSLTLNGLAQ